MLGKLFEHRRRILLESQDIVADDGVKRLVEYYLDGIALAKEHIAAPTRNCSCPRRRYSSRRSVHPDDRTAVTDQVRRQERYVSGAATDIKHAHDTGRKGLAAQQVLRSLILMRVKNWDYRELRERIADGLTLRQFTDFNAQPVPKHDAFQRAFTRLTPQTLKLINDLLVQAAVAMGLEDGSRLRVDTTVVATDIHHPTDNTLP